MGAFVNRLKTETITLHSGSQLKGVHHTPNPSIQGYTKWIRAQRDIHARLQTFPIQPKVDLVECLDTELFYLDLELHRQDIPLNISELPESDYATYLENLQMHVLGCHWYNVVFAHLVGGNTFVAKSVTNALPARWIETSDFFRLKPDTMQIEALRQSLEDHAQQKWSEIQRDQCVRETSAAFRLGTELHQLLKD